MRFPDKLGGTRKTKENRTEKSFVFTGLTRMGQVFALAVVHYFACAKLFMSCIYYTQCKRVYTVAT